MNKIRRIADWWSLLLIPGTIVFHVEIPGAQWYINSSAYNEFPFMNAEHLEFKVKWGFIRLGTISFRQEQADKSNAFHISSEARSAAGLPFVDVDLKNWAVLLADAPHNLEFRFLDNSKSKSQAFYSYDSVSHTLTLKGIENARDTVTKEIRNTEACYDALGFLMLLRTLSGSGYNIIVPVIMGYDLKPTEIVFHRDVEEIKIGLWDVPVLAHRFELKGNWSDPHSGGTKGEMTGWVSADSSAVPLLIRVKITVGSIDVELESCTRTGWTPPLVFGQTAVRTVNEEGEK